MLNISSDILSIGKRPDFEHMYENIFLSTKTFRKKNYVKKVQSSWSQKIVEFIFLKSWCDRDTVFFSIFHPETLNRGVSRDFQLTFSSIDRIYKSLSFYVNFLSFYCKLWYQGNVWFESSWIPLFKTIIHFLLDTLLENNEH